MVALGELPDAPHPRMFALVELSGVIHPHMFDHTSDLHAADELAHKLSCVCVTFTPSQQKLSSWAPGVSEFDLGVEWGRVGWVRGACRLHDIAVASSRIINTSEVSSRCVQVSSIFRKLGDGVTD